MPTISDVAVKAGVSPATVSRVIQGAKNVHPATREKVERAIEELGYVPSAVAQSLRSKRTRSLALLVSDITNPFWTTIARGVEDEAQGQGYSVLLCNTDESLAKQQRYLDLLIGQQVDGVIIAPFDSDAQHLDKLRQRNIPTVIIDRRIEGWEVDSVRGDSVSGAQALVQHLIQLGHRQIAVVSGPRNTSTAEDRITGYRRALEAAGIPVDSRLIRRGEYRATIGEELTHQLLDEGLRPTAVFATNNAIAMGVIDALAKRGLRIPQDLALVSFDDLPDISHLFPFLTVLAQPAYDMGANAAQLLLSRLSSEVNLRPRHVVLPSRLIVRHSCGGRLAESGECPLSLPITDGASEQIRIVPRPGQGEWLDPGTAGRAGPGAAFAASPPASGAPDWRGSIEKSELDRLLRVLQHREADLQQLGTATGVQLLDTRAALIVTYLATNLPIVIWLMRDYFLTVPKELEECAAVDGASRYRVFWSIVLPVSLPGLVATFLFVLVFAWNEYLLALFLSGADAQTLPLTVAAQNATRGPQWWYMSVLILIMILPVIVMAIILERYIARGLLVGAVKG